ncbi:MAG: glycosyltransferase [bacterium]|nr:glycosyltransferase [bacterium]
MGRPRRTALFYIPYTAVGGSHHSLLGFIEGLPPGWRPVVVYNEENPAFRKLYEGRGVECRRLEAPGILHVRGLRRPWRLARDLYRTVRGLRRIIKKERAALLYGESFIGRLLAGLAVVGLPTAALGYIRMCRDAGLADRLAYALADAYVVISETVLRAAVPWALLRPHKLFKIFNGVRLDRFRPGPPDAGLKKRLGLNGHPTIGYYGRFAPFKCPDTLLESVALLRGRGHTQVRLLLVGEPQEDAYPGFASKLEAIIAREGLGGAVVRAGFVADVRDYVRAADIVAVPSDLEPFGRAVIEAMALERPVVGGNNGGIPEIATDGVDALLVPPRDPVALADALERLLDDPALAGRLAEAGRRTVERRFDMRRNQEKLRALVELLVRRRAGYSA